MCKNCEILNIHHFKDKSVLENDPDYVYIGRGSIWGNPYPLQKKKTPEEKDVERDRVIAEYKKYLWVQIKLGKITLEQLASLEGKKLGCFCYPKPCHGDILCLASKWASQEIKKPK